MAKTIGDLDDNSLLTLFENFPNLNILGVVGQVCSRWAEIANKCKSDKQSVVIVVQNHESVIREARNIHHRFDRYLDGKVIDEAADAADHLFTAVATPNVRPSTANQIRLSNATLEHNLEQIAEQFPRVTSLALVVLTTPDDLLLCLPLLQTYAAQLTKLRLYLQYDEDVEDDCMHLLEIAKHTEVLHCINTSMSALRHLTINGNVFLFPWFSERPIDGSRLRILRQLDEFYIKSLDFIEELPQMVRLAALENLNRHSEGTLQIGLVSCGGFYQYLKNLLGTPQPNQNVDPFLRTIKHIALNLDETFFVHLPRLQHLVALHIAIFSPREIGNRSLTDLLRTIAQLPLLTKLQFFFWDNTAWKHLLDREKLVPAEEKTVSLPSVRYFEVQLNDSVWAVLNHNLLDALRVSQTFPSLRVAMIRFVEKDHLKELCRGCRQRGVRLEDRWLQCQKPMLSPFLLAPQLRRVFLGPDGHCLLKTPTEPLL